MPKRGGCCEEFYAARANTDYGRGAEYLVRSRHPLGYLHGPDDAAVRTGGCISAAQLSCFGATDQVANFGPIVGWTERREQDFVWQFQRRIIGVVNGETCVYYEDTGRDRIEGGFLEAPHEH